MKYYSVKRHIMFFAVLDIVSEGRLKVFFTEEAINRFERDGFLHNLSNDKCRCGHPRKDHEKLTVTNPNYTDGRCEKCNGECDYFVIDNK